MKSTTTRNENFHADELSHMIHDILVVAGVQSFRAGLDNVGTLVMQAVEALGIDSDHQARMMK